MKLDIYQKGGIAVMLFVVGIFMILNNVSASDYLTHPQNNDFNFNIPAPNATQCNFTLIEYPDGSSKNFNIIMEQNGLIWNYTIKGSNYSITGDTCMYATCLDPSATPTTATGSRCRDVTVTGSNLTSAKSTSYTIILIISILIFLGLIWLGAFLPYENKRDEFTGYIIAISNIKYFKLVCLGFSYITLVWISYFSWMIVYAFLDFEFLSKIFQFMFYFLAICTLPLFILFAYLTISNLVRDSQIGDSLMRGLRVR